MGTVSIRIQILRTRNIYGDKNQNSGYLGVGQEGACWVVEMFYRSGW